MNDARAGEINCPCCGKRILDGSVLTCRVLIVGADGSRAKCPRCKAMVKVPLQFTAMVPKAAAPA